MRKNVLASLIIAIGIVVLGLSLKSGIDNFAYNDRQVTVRGLAEREVKANKVTWPIVYKQVGNDLQALWSNINSTNETIVKFLTDNGVSRDEILVNAPQVIDLQADRYSSNDIRFRYNVTSIITVTSSEVDKINALINRQAELLKVGIAITAGDWDNKVTYDFTDLNAIKPDMIAEATKNAREAAEKFAADSDSNIGKIRSASQGQFSIEDRDQYTPYIKKIRVVSTIVYYLED